MAQTETDALSQHVEADPIHTGPGDVRLVASGVAVWAIVGHLAAVEWDLAQTAEDYAIPVVEVEAALA